MDKYATKEELKLAIKDLSHQIEANHIETKSSLNRINDKIDENMAHIETRIEEKIELSHHRNSEERRKENRETRRYVIGTILLGVISIAVSLFI